MTAPVIQIKRGSINNLPALAAGEPGFTTDTSEFYIGLDGTLSGNKFIGATRYWRKETSGGGGGVNLYESTVNGSSYIGLRAPSQLPSNVTYVLPAQPIEGFVLKTNSAGVLSWSNQIDFASSPERILNIGLTTESLSNTSWDSGILFNYYKSGQRYRSGVFWDDSNGRVGIASNISNIFNEFGTDVNSPIIDTSTLTWAPLEIKSLWINDCAGQSEVITCSDSERTLENISIDGGFY